VAGAAQGRVAIAAVLLAVAAAGRAEPLLVPGRMGFNALPALRNVDPAVGRDVEVELTAATQLSGVPARDAAFTPYFRISVPFREVAALELDGVPLELFRTSAATQARLEAGRREGVAPGDLRPAARFLLVGEAGRRPAIGLRLAVKSTTGKDRRAFRFSNAPGYVFDVLAGKDLPRVGGIELRALAKLGFFAWQVAGGRQDDALHYGATLRARFPSGVSLSTELRGYAGWRVQDKPMVLGVTAGVPAARRLQVLAGVDGGLSRDAPPLEVRIGVVMSFDAVRLPPGPDASPAPPPAVRERSTEPRWGPRP
jgi:hypothetical protein